MALIYLAAAWLAGIYVGLAVAAAGRPAPLLAAVGGAMAALWWRRPGVRLAFLCLVVAALGTWRSAASIQPIGPHHVARYNGGTVVVQGLVVAEPEVRRGTQRLSFAAQHLLAAGQPVAVDGTIAVVAPRYPEFRFGDELSLKGLLETPPDFDGFSYREYLARQGVHSLLRYPEIDLLARGGERGGWQLLYGLRESVRAALRRHLPEPQTSLAAALLIGDRGDIPDDLVEAFRAVGASHILAISGWQVSIVVGLIAGIGGRLLRTRRSVAFVVALVGVLAYTSLVGAAPSVVRAAIMGVAALVAVQLGRPRDALVALSLACLAMTLFQPTTLLDVGFQLSALATWGLIVLAPRFDPWLGRLPAHVGSVLALTLAAQLAVLPVLATNFQQVSPVSFVVNLVAVPLVPGALEWSALTAVLGQAFATLGTIAGWVAWLYLATLTSTVELAARIPYASLNVASPHPAFAWAYYGLLLLLLDGGRQAGPAWAALRSRLAVRPPWRLAAACGCVAVLSFAGLILRHDGTLRLSVLDVGQGDAVLVRSPAGHAILIDGGPDGQAIGNALGRRLSYGVKTLDLVVLTHPHDDHLIGLIDVLQTYRVRQVLQGPPPERPSPAYSRWCELLHSLNVPVVAAVSGQQIDLGRGARLLVMYAGEAWDGADERLNEASLVLRLERGPFAAYLLGDAGPEAQAWLLARGHLPTADVLKVPHHGAAGSLADAFVGAVAPRAAVISVGRSNRFGHPSLETLAQLGSADVYRTDLDGTIEIVAGERDYRVERSR